MSSVKEEGKIRPLAIVTGLIIDIGGSTLAAVPLALAFGADPTDPSAYERLVAASSTFVLVALPLGLCFTAAGGFVAAHLARGQELNNAFVVGIASAITGLLFATGSSLPLAYLAASIALTVPAALAGGYVRARTRA